MPRSKTSPKNAQPEEDANPAAEAATLNYEAATLNYNEAHTALQLTLAALQANDVDVEEMTTLYRRARLYLERCEAVLEAVEQEVMQWEGAEANPLTSDTGLNPTTT